MNDFERRMAENSEQVYQQIVNGGVDNVEAALMDAQFNASQSDPENK